MSIFRRILIIVCLSGFTCQLFSQKTEKESVLAGIYITLKDFQTNKLTYEIDCRKEKLKIKLHDFFEKPYIDVIYEGKKITLQKKDIYGFRNCENNVFRFFLDHEYKLVESGNINIYTTERMEMDGKIVKTVEDYYFSSQPNGDIKELTLFNLKAAFPDNDKFHDELDEMFKNRSISEYDSFHKMFKVNHVYLMSLTK